MKNDMPNKKGASPFYRDHVKRVIDLVIAIPVFIIAFIPMIIIGIAVKLDSPGPILFKQDRIGKNGKVFSMLKFRSMCVGAEKKGSGVYSGKGDARVTKVGRIIRATSLDELPQLINVLRGDMSLLGPRPPLTYHPWPIEEYTEEQLHMFDVRPGFSGWAQVHGRKDVEWNHVLYDEIPKICCTRYGNVMCSRGSVIPLWIDQIKAGNPITLTEPSMTRFIMSLEEAVDLVLFAFEHGENGDLLIQKAPACTVDCGQVSINISKPGITKGQHWHNSKWEQFIVVHGHGLIQERNINTGETVEFEVSGDKIEAIYMIPGWTHNIINLSETEDLVTVMTCNEVFDPAKPDTFFEVV